MKQTVIYALDFDGVICDSAVETGISGWKAAFQLWEDFETAYPTEQQIEQFRQVRPIMGTGYEAILIVRLMNDGESVESILETFHVKKNEIIDQYKLEIDDLKKLYGETRDAWIKEDLEDWVEKNPLFPGMVEKLQNLSTDNVWYILTTKQERFVKLILSANQVQLPDDRIFGLDRNMSKENILIDLREQHTDKQFYFVEDMLSSLVRVLNNSQLKSVKLLLALWGYNTAQDKLDAEQYGFELIEFDGFLV